MKTYMIFACMCIFSIVAFSTFAENISEDELIDDTSHEICVYMVEDMNISEGMNIPKYIPYGNERMNVYSNGETVGHIITEDGSITSLDCTHIENVTLTVNVTNIGVVSGIFSAESSVDALNDAFLSNDIAVEGDSFFKNTKIFMMETLVMIVSLFA